MLSYMTGGFANPDVISLYISSVLFFVWFGGGLIGWFGHFGFLFVLVWVLLGVFLFVFGLLTYARMWEYSLKNKPRKNSCYFLPKTF